MSDIQARQRNEDFSIYGRRSVLVRVFRNTLTHIRRATQKTYTAHIKTTGVLASTLLYVYIHCLLAVSLSLSLAACRPSRTEHMPASNERTDGRRMASSETEMGARCISMRNPSRMHCVCDTHTHTHNHADKIHACKICKIQNCTQTHTHTYACICCATGDSSVCWNFANCIIYSFIFRVDLCTTITSAGRTRTRRSCHRCTRWARGGGGGGTHLAPTEMRVISRNVRANAIRTFSSGMSHYRYVSIIIHFIFSHCPAGDTMYEVKTPHPTTVAPQCDISGRVCAATKRQP